MQEEPAGGLVRIEPLAVGVTVMVWPALCSGTETATNTTPSGRVSECAEMAAIMGASLSPIVVFNTGLT
jgi:hypothetical protein